jgi:hypothetical protein
VDSVQQLHPPGNAADNVRQAAHATNVVYRTHFPVSKDSFNTLWIGERLTPVERACLQSFVTHGHRITLWCYELPEDVPEGVAIGDAGQILPADQIIRYRSGSVSLFSNRFRYELQRRGLGVWVDTDFYLLTPMPALPHFTFAWESDERIGTAVLRLPPDSQLTASLLRIFAEKDVPEWMPIRDRTRARLRLWRTGRIGLHLMPWGTAGPRAVTHFCRRYELGRRALPSDMFYPVHWSRADWLLNPSISVDSVITERTVGIHLWNELIKDHKLTPAPRGSFLARLQDEGTAKLPAAHRSRASA